MQVLLRNLSDHYMEAILQADWAGDPQVLSAWHQSMRGWRISTERFEVLSNYPPEAGTATRMLVTETSELSVTVSLKPDGLKGTPGPNLQPGKAMYVVIQILGEARGFASAKRP